MSAIRAAAMLSLIGFSIGASADEAAVRRMMPLEEVRSLLDRASPPEERGSAK